VQSGTLCLCSLYKAGRLQGQVAVLAASAATMSPDAALKGINTGILSSPLRLSSTCSCVYSEMAGGRTECTAAPSKGMWPLGDRAVGEVNQNRLLPCKQAGCSDGEEALHSEQPMGTVTTHLESEEPWLPVPALLACRHSGCSLCLMRATTGKPGLSLCKSATFSAL
jgi:hypothetical protein